MRFHTLLFSVCLFVCSGVLAQKTFNGYYINLEGDTVRVNFPNYNQWVDNPKQVKVVATNNVAVDLTPGNCKSFVVDGEDRYVSKHFRRLVNPTDVSLNEDAYLLKDSFETVDGFLRQLTEVNGNCLYKYQDKVRENYFLENRDGSFEELKFKVYKGENSNSRITDDSYKVQLQQTFGDQLAQSDKYQRMLSNLDYNEAALTKFVEGVNHKKVPAKKGGHPGEFVLLAGVSDNTFSISPASRDLPNTLAVFDRNVSPVIGLGFTTHQQRNFGKNFFTVLLKYYQFRNTGAFTNFGDHKDQVTYQSQILSLNLALGREFVKNTQFSWYAAFSPHLDLMLNNTETYAISGKVTKGAGLLGGVNLQTGVIISQRLGTWLHYDVLPLDVQHYAAFSTYHHDIQAGLSWQFLWKR